MYRVKQKDTSDCAVASLISIIKYYKGNISYEKLRNMMKCSKDGVSAYDLVKTANKVGFNAYGLRCNLEDLNKLKLPCIAHTIAKGVYMHYVVIESVSNKIKVYDPYFGKKVYKKEEFLKIWTNVVIILEEKNIVKEKEKNTLYKEIFDRYKYKFLILGLMSLLLVMLSIISTYYFKALIENVNNSKTIYILFAILILVKHILEYFTNKIIFKIDVNLEKEMTLSTLKNILLLKEEYFINRQKGDILGRINNIESIKLLLLRIPIMLFMYLNIIFICIVILINLNRRLFFISLVIVVIYSLIYLLFFKKNKHYIKQVEEEKGYINGVLGETISGFKELRNHGLMNYKLKTIEKAFNNYKGIKYKFNNLYNLESTIKNILLLILSNYVLYIGLSDLKISNLILFYSILIMFVDSFKGIFDMEEEFTNGLVSINRLNEIYGDNSYVGYYSNRIDTIDINNLSFSYKNDEFIIENLSIKVSKGDRVLVQGNSGVGKTTLFSLIQGEYSIDQGTVKLGKEDLYNWNKIGIEENISYGNITSKIFRGRVIDNIGDDIRIDRLRDVLNITNLTLDLNYILEEDGSNISLGERSKLILTRILYKGSSVLILDELLSNIEILEEKRILLNLFERYKDKIIIYTSHRNIDQSLFNKVLTLKKGRDYEFNGI